MLSFYSFNRFFRIFVPNTKKDKEETLCRLTARIEVLEAQFVAKQQEFKEKYL